MKRIIAIIIALIALIGINSNTTSNPTEIAEPISTVAETVAEETKIESSETVAAPTTTEITETDLTVPEAKQETTVKAPKETTAETPNQETSGITIGSPTQEQIYSCGVAGHHCAGPETHSYICELEQKGCEYCGSHSCPSFYATDEWGQGCYDPSKCPQYLYCKRLIGSADASCMKVKEFKTFKKLTGGDTIRAEFKGLKAFNFTFNGLMWLCMNVLPKFGGDNGPWVYERIMIVSCNNVIPKNKQDKQLLEKMYAEKEGIIVKSVKALLKVIENGYRFDEPKSVTEMREKYMNDNNTVVTFFEECMYARAENQSFDDCTTGKIYKAYKVWCRNNYPGFSETERDFRSKIAKIIGGEYRDAVVRRNGSSFFKSFTLTLEAKRDYCTANA